jgi:hypothetical protein
MDDLSAVNAEEMGEVMDMIKDISETIYYHTVTEAMHDKETWGWDKKEEGRSNMTRKMYMEHK